MNFDNFYTTDSKENQLYSEEIFKSLDRNKKISTKEIEQYFDEDKQMFLPDRFIKGECPKCNARINMVTLVKLVEQPIHLPI